LHDLNLLYIRPEIAIGISSVFIRLISKIRVPFFIKDRTLYSDYYLSTTNYDNEEVPSKADGNYPKDAGRTNFHCF